MGEISDSWEFIGTQIERFSIFVTFFVLEVVEELVDMDVHVELLDSEVHIEALSAFLASSVLEVNL